MHSHTIRRFIIRKPVIVLLVAFALVGLLQTVHLVSAVQTQQAARSAAAYRSNLTSQVQKTDGSPADGRNPTAQRQTSLAEVASLPAGNGQQGSAPAHGVSGDHNHAVKPSDVIADSKATGILSNGCFADYGKPGEECLPVAQVGTTPTCDSVRGAFPNGIVVSGKDRFNLDKNKDKTACGQND